MPYTHTRCSYQDRRPKSGNVSKSSGLSEFEEHWIEKYFLLVFTGLIRGVTDYTRFRYLTCLLKSNLWEPQNDASTVMQSRAFAAICHTQGTAVLNAIPLRLMGHMKRCLMFMPLFWNVLHVVGEAKYTLQRWIGSVREVEGRRQSPLCAQYFLLFGLYRVIHKSVKHFKNSQQINYSTDQGSSYADRERNSPFFFLIHIS